MARIVALVLAYTFLTLAIVGVFLPVLPTVPFLLLAAWFSAKGSERLHRWLYEHPRFGKLLIDWEKHGAISRKSKVVAVIALIASWTFLYFHLENLWGLTAMAILFFAVASYIISRPTP